jgi:hypothetical protein
MKHFLKANALEPKQSCKTLQCPISLCGHFYLIIATWDNTYTRRAVGVASRNHSFDRMSMSRKDSMTGLE